MTAVDAPASEVAGASWSLRFDYRPWTTNKERTWHHHQRAAVVKVWREAFAMLAKAQRIPQLEAVTITVTPYLKDGRGRQDVGGCHPAAKAAIDGLCDAGVLPGDRPEHVRSLTFLAPIIGQGDGLELVIEETVIPQPRRFTNDQR